MNKKIAWEKWDVDLLEQEMIDNVIETSDESEVDLIEEALEKQNILKFS